MKILNAFLAITEDPGLFVCVFFIGRACLPTPPLLKLDYSLLDQEFLSQSGPLFGVHWGSPSHCASHTFFPSPLPNLLAAQKVSEVERTWAHISIRHSKHACKSQAPAVNDSQSIEHFHSRGQHLCKSIGTNESVYIRKKFNSHWTDLEHQHGRRFIVLEHQYGRRDVMWKRSMVTVQ